MKQIVNLVIAGSLSVVLAGCSDEPAPLAVVSGKPITQETFDAYLKYKRIPVDSEAKAEAALDRFLTREALASTIERSGLLEAAEIAVELNEFKKQMLISRYFDKFLQEKVSDVAARNYYTSNAELYQNKKAMVSHLLLRVNDAMSDTERKAKLTKAHEAYSKIRAGEDFTEIVKLYSEDKVSAKKGGSLGWLKEGAIDPVFSKTAFELKEGGVSEPVLTSFGYHIIKLDEAAKVIQKPFEAVQGDIRYQLRAQAKRAEMDRLTQQFDIKRSS